MPTYDPVEQRMAVRIVYDGVACAGKTTNLRQLCTLFASQRATDVLSPSEMHGRTLYFDWMQIAAGVVCGFPLLCQVVSVPGQVVLTPRRRYLLTTADVIVYVCESTEAALSGARAGLALYDEIARERGSAIPLVIQANKQDTAAAMDGGALARALGRDGTPVVEAIASEGIGVVDTFVTAVRTVARSLQERSEEQALQVEVRRADTASEVLARLAREQLDPAWAAEMVLEEAHAAFLFEEAVRVAAADARMSAPTKAAADELVRLSPRDSAGPAPEPKRSSTSVPVFPTADVPTGFIWPAHTGRAIVRGLTPSPALTAPDASGKVSHVVGAHVVHTSIASRHVDSEAARQALVRTARRCTQVDRWLLPDTVLVAQAVDDGSCWIWTARPHVPTMDRLAVEGQATSSLLGAYAAAVVEVLSVSLRHGFSVDPSLASFGVRDQRMWYVGPLSNEPPGAEALSSSMFAAVEAVERAGADVTALLEVFERELPRRFTRDERAASARTRAEPLSPPRGVAGTRLLAMFDGTFDTP